MLQSRTSVCAFENTIGRQLCNSGENVAKPSGDVEQNSARQECERERNQHRVDRLLSDDVGTVVEHNDELLYAFFNADQIVDFLLSIGMRPFVELSFMPTALASGSKTVFHYRGNVTPPKDYKQWSTLIHTLVAHWVARYGIREVAEWFFEVWNEPNLKAFWTGTKEDYFKLYRAAADAVKKVDVSLKVGGPATARDGWIDEFLEFCQAGRIPIDFVSTHHYPTDAVGHEDDDTETQLANSERGVLREWAQDTRRRAGELPVYYTEWNSSSNPRDPRHDEPYSAAFVAKTALAAGAPDYLDGPAVERLHEASRLTRQACPRGWREERIALEIELPPHGVAALTTYVNQQYAIRNPKGFRDSQNHFALDQGPVILMIENYRSGLIWRLMRSCSDVVVGLRRAGFRGGWLTGLPPTTPGRQLRS